MAYSQGAGSCPQGAGSATEANALAVETPDLRERDLLFEIADQWRLLAAHRAVNKQTVLKLVTDKPPSGQDGNGDQLSNAGTHQTSQDDLRRTSPRER